MKVFRLPTDKHNFDMSLQLDGVDYVMRFLWNGREERWYFELLDSSGESLTGQRKFVADYGVYDKLAMAGLPGGRVICFSSTHTDPGLFDLTTNALLLYVPEEDLV